MKTQHQFSSRLMLVIVRGVILIGKWIIRIGLSNHFEMSQGFFFHKKRRKTKENNKQYLSLLVSQRNEEIYMAGTHCCLIFGFFSPLALVFRKHASSAELKKLRVLHFYLGCNSG